MSWSRSFSHTEELMTQVLKEKNRAMTIREIVTEIVKIDSNCLNGKNPTKSLYSIIYRREKRRILNNKPKAFTTSEDRGQTLYSLNKFK